jgi:hypothetical protein
VGKKRFTAFLLDAAKVVCGKQGALVGRSHLDLGEESWSETV